MKFFLDENMPLSSLDVFSSLGFEAQHAKNAGFRGASDKEISNFAKEEQAILVTKDAEFGNLLAYPKGSHHGLLILRLPDFTAKQINVALKAFFREKKADELINALTVIEIGKYRIRRL